MHSTIHNSADTPQLSGSSELIMTFTLYNLIDREQRVILFDLNSYGLPQTAQFKVLADSSTAEYNRGTSV